jgi:hypothetical protein
MIEPLATSLRATVWMAAPLMAEIASEWIKDGTAERLVEQKRAEALARQEIARRTLAGFEFDAHPLSFHLWLHLPEPWRSNEFTAQLRQRGVFVTPPEAFVPGREEAPHAVRVCLGATRSRVQFESDLDIIREVLKDTPNPSLSILRTTAFEFSDSSSHGIRRDDEDMAERSSLARFGSPLWMPQRSRSVIERPSLARFGMALRARVRRTHPAR